MRAIDAGHHEPVTITADGTIADGARLMDEHGVGAVVVVDADGRPTGIVTDRDIAVRAVARDVGSDARIDYVMSTDLVTVSPNTDVRDVLAILREHRFRRVPIVDGHRLVGMVTADDLLLRTFDDLSDLLLPVTKQTLYARPEAKPPVPADG